MLIFYTDFTFHISVENLAFLVLAANCSMYTLRILQYIILCLLYMIINLVSFVSIVAVLRNNLQNMFHSNNNMFTRYYNNSKLLQTLFIFLIPMRLPQVVKYTMFFSSYFAYIIIFILCSIKTGTMMISKKILLS